MLGKDDAERWFLFLGGTDCANLRSCCQAHHDAKVLAFESGREEFNPLSATGDRGREFLSSTMLGEQLDAGLPQSQAEIDDLLSGLPE